MACKWPLVTYVTIKENVAHQKAKAKIEASKCCDLVFTEALCTFLSFTMFEQKVLVLLCC